MYDAELTVGYELLVTTASHYQLGVPCQLGIALELRMHIAGVDTHIEACGGIFLRTVAMHRTCSAATRPAVKVREYSLGFAEMAPVVPMPLLGVA